ncbi:hypothetical protein TWF718_010192 [Orbilia javanica]|uniref:Uncharacterized protein n=1 Tax=Orbilia javanica TaxID=47235 RepID=A0AAN8MQA7_9PEZI
MWYRCHRSKVTLSWKVVHVIASFDGNSICREFIPPAIKLKGDSGPILRIKTPSRSSTPKT